MKPFALAVGISSELVLKGKSLAKVVVDFLFVGLTGFDSLGSCIFYCLLLHAFQYIKAITLFGFCTVRGLDGFV